VTSNEVVIGGTDTAQPSIAVEGKEELSRSISEQDIRNRAYWIYLQRGAQPGCELEDWLQAERELCA
jgi:Protein of unknown function (DUF2934)